MRERLNLHNLRARGLEGMALALRNTESLQTEATVRELLAKAEAERHRDKAAYLALARMAAEMAGRLEGGRALDLQVRARAVMGNALRKSGRYRESQEVFAELVPVAAGAAAAERAHALALHGSLLRDRRAYAAAAAELRTAISIYRQLGDEESAIRQHVKLGCTLIDAGEYREAQVVLATALRELTVRPFDGFLLALCCGNFVYLLVEAAGEADESERHQLLGTAMVAAEYARRVLTGFAPKPYAVQLEWTYTRLLRIDGKLEPAGALLDCLIQDFVEIGEPLYGAVAALDLAEIHLEQGRVEALRQLGSACLEIFRAAELLPELWTAFRLCQQAEDLVALRLLIQQTVARCGAPQGSAPRGLDPS